MMKERPTDTGFLPQSLLPKGFIYPNEFVRLMEMNLDYIEPWFILKGDFLLDTFVALRSRYPSRQLIPFARRQDNDDVACWEVGSEGDVVIIHDFATPGWEQRKRFPDFWSWFRQAIEDMIEFE